ncbi:Hpt domain-containing protein, partial [Pseudomonas otitidis]
AHSFKGSCSNMGAPLLSSLCKQLEEAGRREQLDEAPSLPLRHQREVDAHMPLLQPLQAGAALAVVLGEPL